MDDNDHKRLDSLERFVSQIAKSPGLGTVSKAAETVSEDLGIGRIICELNIPPNRNLERGRQERFVLFTAEDGFDKTSSCESIHDIPDPGTVKIIACALPGRSFDGAMETHVNTIMDLVFMHFSRYFLGEKVERSTMTQVLTGLPNTSGYLRAVGQKYVLGTISGYDSYYFNLKGFGLINKRFGQREGSEIICRYAAELKKFLEEDELLGHLGGDNFVALIHKGERSRSFQKLLLGVKVTGVQDGIEVPLTIPAVAGFMHIEMPCAVDRIIGGPSIAIAYAKRTKQMLVELTDELANEVNRAKAIEQGFRKALANNEFTVFYQPKVNSVTGKIIGCEALTRWFENGRMVSPAAFIPILEQTGQIAELDLAMLELVCQDISAWKASGNESVPASVNFSRKDLSDPFLPDKILKIIHQYSIERSDIVIEVTETTSEEEQSQMAVFLSTLREFGIETSIDDFGTGYSSLSVLREFPVGEIKIDRSFINHELEDSDEIIIRSIIDMANKLSINVITEGVEEISQKEFLHRLGCDRIQGFLYDKPLPKDQFERRLKTGYYELTGA